MTETFISKVVVWMDFMGYGFIDNPNPEDTRDVYVSGKDVPLREGIGKRLRKGETVQFEIEPRPKGLRAKNISIVIA